MKKSHQSSHQHRWLSLDELQHYLQQCIRENQSGPDNNEEETPDKPDQIFLHYCRLY